MQAVPDPAAPALGSTGFQPSAAQRLSLLNAWQRGFPLCDEPFAVVGAALDLSAAQVLQAYRQLAHGGHAEAYHGLGDRHEGAPRAVGRGGVGQLQEAAGEGRIGLHDAGDLVDAGIVPAADFHDRQCHALGARQLAAEAQLFYRHAVGLVRFG
jgi:hypothetical protein